jgi:hypothetical protein
VEVNATARAFFVLIQINPEPGGPLQPSLSAKMQRYDWLTIAWGLWTAVLAVSLAYLLFFP